MIEFKLFIVKKKKKQNKKEQNNLRYIKSLTCDL